MRKELKEARVALDLSKSEHETLLILQQTHKELEDELWGYKDREGMQFRSPTTSMIATQFELDQEKLEEEKQREKQLSDLMEKNQEMEQELEYCRRVHVSPARTSSSSSNEVDFESAAIKQLQAEVKRLQSEIFDLERDLNERPTESELRDKIEKKFQYEIEGLQTQLNTATTKRDDLGMAMEDQDAELQHLRKLGLNKRTLDQMKKDLEEEQELVAQERKELEENFQSKQKEFADQLSARTRAVEDAEDETRKVEKKLEEQCLLTKNLEDELKLLKFDLNRQEDLSSQLESSLNRHRLLPSPPVPTSSTRRGRRRKLPQISPQMKERQLCLPGEGDKASGYRQMYQDLDCQRAKLLIPGKEKDKQRFYAMVYGLMEFTRASAYYWLQELRNKEDVSKIKALGVEEGDPEFKGMTSDFEELSDRVRKKSQTEISEREYISLLVTMKKLMPVIKACSVETVMVLKQYAYHISENLINPDKAKAFYEVVKKDDAEGDCPEGMDEDGYEVKLLLDFCAAVLPEERCDEDSQSTGNSYPDTLQRASELVKELHKKGKDHFLELKSLCIELQSMAGPGNMPVTKEMELLNGMAAVLRDRLREVTKQAEGSALGASLELGDLTYLFDLVCNLRVISTQALESESESPTSESDSGSPKPESEKREPVAGNTPQPLKRHIEDIQEAIKSLRIVLNSGKHAAIHGTDSTLEEAFEDFGKKLGEIDEYVRFDHRSCLKEISTSLLDARIDVSTQNLERLSKQVVKVEAEVRDDPDTVVYSGEGQAPVQKSKGLARSGQKSRSGSVDKDFPVESETKWKKRQEEVEYHERIIQKAKELKRRLAELDKKYFS